MDTLIENLPAGDWTLDIKYKKGKITQIHVDEDGILVHVSMPGESDFPISDKLDYSDLDEEIRKQIQQILEEEINYV